MQSVKWYNFPNIIIKEGYTNAIKQRVYERYFTIRYK